MDSDTLEYDAIGWSEAGLALTSECRPKRPRNRFADVCRNGRISLYLLCQSAKAGNPLKRFSATCTRTRARGCERELRDLDVTGSECANPSKFDLFSPSSSHALPNATQVTEQPTGGIFAPVLAGPAVFQA